MPQIAYSPLAFLPLAGRRASIRRPMLAASVAEAKKPSRGVLQGFALSL
jgi:hypothetical protein